MNYIEEAKQILSTKITVEDELLDLYTLLVFTSGEFTTLRNIHDAWAIWRSRTKPDHRSLVPFEDLSRAVQELDREYAIAVIETARALSTRA